jgi:SOS-response transcriptional repressor LexA
MDIGMKIREARKAKGLTLEALANQVDTDTGNLSRLERGKQGASQDLLSKIMKTLEMTVTHILPNGMYGQLTFPHDNVMNKAAHDALITHDLELAKPRKYPVVSWHEGMEWATSPEAYFPEDTDEMYASDAEPVGEAFWLRVTGDSMAWLGNPSFPEGSLILIDPRCALISGKYFAFSIGQSGDFTLKQYVEDAGLKYLRPLNNHYRVIDLKDEYILIGRVIDVKMLGL